MNLRRFFALFLVLSLVLAASSSSEARRHHRRHHRRGKKRAVINEPDLYQRIGGAKMVSELVDTWVRDAVADGRLSQALGDTTKPAVTTKLKKDLVQEVCELSDGPCKSADAKKQPDVFGMNDEKFVVFADHLVRSMDKLKIREREKNELLGRIGEARTNANAGDTAEPDNDDDVSDDTATD